MKKPPDPSPLDRHAPAKRDVADKIVPHQQQVSERQARQVLVGVRPPSRNPRTYKLFSINYKHQPPAVMHLPKARYR